MVNSFEYLRVELESASLFEGQFHNLESISESLNADTNGSVSHVGVLSLDNGVVVPVNNAVKILSYALSDLVEVLEVER